MISTFYKKVVSFIHKTLNFHGLLITDALSMQALKDTSFEERAVKSSDDGSDFVILDKENTNKIELALKKIKE